jgi:ribose 5-phosphate isomerase A
MREKIVAASAQLLVIVADQSKILTELGTHAPLPVEVIAFGLPLCERRLAQQGCTPALRHTPDRTPIRTHEGNLILDCRFSAIADAAALSVAIHAIPGVVEHGLFIGMAERVLVAGAGGISVMIRS